MINGEQSALGTTHSSTHASLLISDSSLKRRFIPFSLEVNLVSNPGVFSVMISNHGRVSQLKTLKILFSVVAPAAVDLLQLRGKSHKKVLLSTSSGAQLSWTQLYM